LLASACRPPPDVALRLPIAGAHPSALVSASRAALHRGDAAGAVSLAARALAAENSLLHQKAILRQPPEWIFDAANRADLPALVAYAEALYAWADGRGAPTLVDAQDRIRYAAQRAFELDRTFSHGAPDRLLGLLDASLPNDDGADPIAAVEHFEAAIAEAPEYLPNRLDYALVYARPRGDRVLYLQLLAQVATADPRIAPDALDENRRARARARDLLAVER
ncbi:MAG TPA: TRAP transporter TatT component family protein, partial [Polyangia bacterium]